MLRVEIFLLHIFLGTVLGRYSFNIGAVYMKKSTRNSPFGSAVDIAMEKIRTTYVNLDIQDYQQPALGKEKLVAALSELHCRHPVDAVVGFGEGSTLLRAWDIPFIIVVPYALKYSSTGSTFSSRTRMYPVNIQSIVAVARAIFKYYSWEHVVFLAHSEFLPAVIEKQVTHSFNYTVMRISPHYTADDLKRILIDANSLARGAGVYVIQGQVIYQVAMVPGEKNYYEDAVIYS